MITPEEKALVQKIRKGEVDVNNQSLFFSILIKGLLDKLNDQLTIRGKNVPCLILHTGDDTMYLSVKGQDASKEPLEITNENYVYSPIPRCIVNPKNIDLLADQLSSPYSNGQLQMKYENKLYTFSGEFRRYPLKMSFDLDFYVDSYTDSLELMQQIISKLVFVQTYRVSYMGQEITCSYTLPTNLSEEHMMEMDGATSERKTHKLSLSIEVETTYPVWQNRTIVSAGQWISSTSNTMETVPAGSIQAARDGFKTVYNGGTGRMDIQGQVVKK